MNRRGFLRNTGRGLIAASLPTVPGAITWAKVMPSLREGAAGLSGSQWETLAVVQDHLFPSEPQTPGAREVQATAYLYCALSAPGADADVRVFIRDGLTRLEKVVTDTGGTSFLALDDQQRETALRTLEKDEDGHYWLSEILQFLMEALLADPLYNANPGGIGWRWLEHTPGFPQPVAGKEYYRLRPNMKPPAKKAS